MPAQTARMQLYRRPPWALIAAWLLLAAGALLLRPLWALDETRYVAVAWEMWQRGEFLVPTLNGAPYSQKPPLFFWCIHLGWAVFGVNDWWPRLVAPLFALAGLWLTTRLARRLWPGREEIAASAAWVTAGSLLWAFLTTFTMFDMLLTFFALLAMLGLTEAWRGRPLRGWAVYGVAIGCGILAKGPVMLLVSLPPALAAPWWMGASRPNPVYWYGGVAGGALVGGAIALAWALPAAQAGGSEYRAAILWSQTAGRVVHAFMHEQPWWWYLPLLPVLLFPWLWWPPLWRGLARLRRAKTDPGMRFTLSWCVPAFAGFSVVSGKQPYYLLPLLPAFALLTSYALHAGVDRARGWDALPPFAALTVLALVWLSAAFGVLAMPPWFAGLSPLPPLLLLGFSLWMAVRAPGRLASRVRDVALGGVGLVAAFYLGIVPVVTPRNDPRPVAAHLAALEKAGRPIAHYGKYHGEFHFAGRLTAPFTVIDDPDRLREWIERHPGGRVVSYRPGLPGSGVVAGDNGGDVRHDRWRAPGATPEFAADYRAGRLEVWARDAVRIATAARRMKTPEAGEPRAPAP
jgi:4-amino-4-deoxy-L-arabinose transferase-like glycosyltransferase